MKKHSDEVACAQEHRKRKEPILANRTGSGHIGRIPKSCEPRLNNNLTGETLEHLGSDLTLQSEEVA